MTPLVASVSAITPAQGVGQSFWCCVTIPELAAYFVPNGNIPANISWTTPSIPIAGPILRAISAYTLRIEVGGGVTAGSPFIRELTLDGNWHPGAVNQINAAANTTYFVCVGPGASYTNGGTVQPSAPPVLGLAVSMNVALAGGNINYMELKAMAEAIDPGFVYGSRLGAVIQ